MPGTVLKVCVQAGDRVEPQAPLVVVESMKMEMTLAAPAAARVREVVCAVGQMVEPGTVLVRLEPLEPDDAAS